MSHGQNPTFQDVLRARHVVYRYLRATPLYPYPGLSDLVGTEVWVKHENHQPVGAFKVRGGLNLASNLSEQEKRRGLATASTGNHGQSIAYAGRVFGVPVVIAMPEGANPEKAAAIRSLGAEVAFHGKDFDEAREWVEARSKEEGRRYVGVAEPHLIAGVATYSLEILEELPDVDVIVAPIGGGSGASGACLVAKTLTPSIQVIGVQAEKAPAAYLSWKKGHLVSASMETFAEGLATRTAFETTQGILRRYLKDFILVSEEEIKWAILAYLKHTHNLAEGAGAVPLAGAMKIRERLAGKKVVLVMSGGNFSLDKLRELMRAPFGDPFSKDVPRA